MAARAIWKGHIRLSLVTVPIRVYPATDRSAEIRFHQLHRVCQTRIEYKKWCPHCEREVTNDELAKGYEFERGRYVEVEPEEIEKVRPESTRVVNLSQVADADAVDPLYRDTPYYLAPDGKVASESFAVLRDALEGKAGIGTVAFHGRERLVAVEPREAGLVMFTLRRTRELRAIGSVDELHDVPKRAKADEVALARKVIGGFEGTIDLSRYTDTYEEALREIIDRKIAGEEVVEPTAVEEPPRVVNLMDALRKSLDQVSSGKKKPAKAGASKAGRKAGRVAKLPSKKKKAS